MKIEMTQTSGAAPVQYEGTIEDKYFYFRARGNEWSFSVADTIDETVDGFSAGEIFLRTGSYGDDQHPFAASYMPHPEAEHLIQACVQEYLAQRNRNTSHTQEG